MTARNFPYKNCSVGVVQYSISHPPTRNRTDLGYIYNRCSLRSDESHAATNWLPSLTRAVLAALSAARRGKVNMVTKARSDYA